VDLVDPLCLEGLPPWKKVIRKSVLKVYALEKRLINKMIGSSYHESSPLVWSFEVKMAAWVENQDGNSAEETSGGRKTLHNHG
jgi:hypothetical protein